jgi:hypothetical protein
MVRRSREPIVRLRERLEWLTDCEPVDLDVDRRVSSPGDLRDLIAGRLKLSEAFNPTWARYLVDGKPSKDVLDAIRDIYPRLRAPGPDLLTCDWEEFSRIVAVSRVDTQGWEAAIDQFSSSRAAVERFGKQLYADFDELPADFPLIGRKAWLADRAIPMTQDGQDLLRSTLTFDHGHETELRLDGLKVPYSAKKIARMHRQKGAPFNGDCYLVKDIRRHDVAI